MHTFLMGMAALGLALVFLDGLRMFGNFPRHTVGEREVLRLYRLYWHPRLKGPFVGKEIAPEGGVPDSSGKYLLVKQQAWDSEYAAFAA